VLRLSDDEVEIAIEELRSAGLLELSGARETVFPTDRLFWETDSIFRTSNPRTDAEEVARTLVDHTGNSMEMAVLATTIDWPPRRLNPATSFLVKNGIAHGTETTGARPFRYYLIQRIPATKRFVRDIGSRAG
jgi:hypothetical protein